MVGVNMFPHILGYLLVGECMLVVDIKAFSELFSVSLTPINVLESVASEFLLLGVIFDVGLVFGKLLSHPSLHQPLLLIEVFIQLPLVYHAFRLVFIKALIAVSEFYYFFGHF